MNEGASGGRSLPVKFTGENIDGFLKSYAPQRSLTKAVISPIYYVANSHNATAKSLGHRERIIMVVLPISPEIEKAADGFSLKHHMIHACKDVVKNKDYYHG